METNLVKTTRQIENEYNISRQTIHNWIKEGLLESPKKDFRNWFTWEKRDEENLNRIIQQKIQQYNKPSDHLQNELLKISNRRYLGSKQKLLEFIEEVVDKNTKGVNIVADVFAGTGVVANLFRSKGKRVIVNDILQSNYVCYQTWFGNEPIDYQLIINIIQELNNIKPKKEDNYVSTNFGNKYFSMENARKIGAIREKIETYELNNREKAFLLTSLLYAMDKIANTVGHYDAYRKKMDTLQPIYLRVPEYNENNYNQIYKEDANHLVRRINADLVYIDTPYNSRQYGDAYHLLENIIAWKKPKVEGVAKKMVDRHDIKSCYSTQKAPLVFDDLIQNIEAKYILVSYNNMAQKGNGRSNAKISNEEIISSLKKRGIVKVFDMPFKVFTTGKSNIEDHRELLYLCNVTKKKKIEEKNNYIKSSINFTGGKFKLLPQIIPLFPQNIENFHDVFAGGANVAINMNVKGKIYINDIEPHLIELYRYIMENNLDIMLKKIEEVIFQYNLTNTKVNGYSYYNANSSNGLQEINKLQYEKLRSDYNLGSFKKENEPLIFYILTVFSFNNQIRFNDKGLFNVPTGKRDFNKSMELKFRDFKQSLSNRAVVLSNKDFRDVIDEIENNEDFIYLDPPYLITTASYNENGGWSEKDEKDLLDKLDELHSRGIRFALSNVLKHKGKENRFLLDWSRKYNVHFLNFNYDNSNYQSVVNNEKTVEVLITNY